MQLFASSGVSKKVNTLPYGTPGYTFRKKEERI